MAFANISVLLFGSMLMGVPILLHLMMKQRPRHQVFPALRFLQRREISNRRQLRLRNWILLLLRLAAIGLVALLLARPSVDSLSLGYWLRALVLLTLGPLALIALAHCWLEKKGWFLLNILIAVVLLLTVGSLYNLTQAVIAGRDSTIGDAQSPIAAALVFDTTPRMGLRHENRTRLDEARQIAQQVIQQLPTDSEVAVVDAINAAPMFSFNMGSAFNMLESLNVSGSDYPFHELVSRGIALVQPREGKRKEVFVFTDLSKASWQEGDYRGIARELARHADIAMFVVDVGVDKPRNIRLGTIQLEAEHLNRGRPLQIGIAVSSQNVDQEVGVEVLLEQTDPTRPVIVDNEVLLPTATTRDRATVRLSPGSSTNLEFELRGLPTGLHHGQVRVDAEDGLTADNTRYFTVEVAPPQAVMIATSLGADGRYLQSVLSPLELQQRGEAWFDCHVVDTNDLPQQILGDYSAIALLDPAALTSEHWKRLDAFVENGGGLAIFLGRNAKIDAFNQAAGRLLPAPLVRHWRTAPNEFLFIAPRDTSHSILAAFRGRESIIPWDESPIFKHWSLGQLGPGTNVVLRYSNDQPAILEHTLGDGRVITMTTPVSDPRNMTDRPAWNHLPTVQQPLPFFLLIRQLFVYLTQQDARQLNHVAGQVIAISVPEPADRDGSWQLFIPPSDWQNARSEDGVVTVTTTDTPGVYRLRRVDSRPEGVSVNLNEEATNLVRLAPEARDAVLGQGKYALARGTQEIDRGVGRTRTGRELYPFLLLIAIGVVAMESLLSNRFYVSPGKLEPRLGLASAQS